jgi:hypothetical protein
VGFFGLGEEAPKASSTLNKSLLDLLSLLYVPSMVQVWSFGGTGSVPSVVQVWDSDGTGL